MTKSKLNKEFENKFKILIHDYMTFGAMDDPENFEPYISFDRKYDFDYFMIKLRKLFKLSLSSELDRARKEEIKNKIFAVDCLMLEIVHLPLEKADMNRLCKLADKLTGEDRSAIYKADSKNK